MYPDYYPNFDGYKTKGSKSDNGDIKLYGWTPVGDCTVSASPYVGKVETFLQLSGLNYEVKAEQIFKKHKYKRGTMPALKHGDDNIPDSHFMINYLENTYGSELKLNVIQDKFQLARANAAQALVEGQLYWATAYLRFMPDDGFRKIKVTFSKALPRIVGSFAMSKARKNVKKQLLGMGMKHNHEDMLTIFKSQVATLSGLLNDQFYGGGQPSRHDCAVFSWLDNALHDGIQSEIREFIKEHQNLVNHHRLMMERAFPSSNPGKFYTLAKKFRD